MTAKDNICECCHQEGHGVGVAAIPGIPMSIYWCSVCLAMGAYPKWLKDDIKYPHVYYEEEDDCYIQAGTDQVVPLKFKDGTIMLTRSDAIEYMERLQNA